MPFTFTLEHEDGSPAEPPTFSTAAPNWRPDDTILLGRETLRVIEVRRGPEPDGASGSPAAAIVDEGARPACLEGVLEAEVG